MRYYDPFEQAEYIYSLIESERYLEMNKSIIAILEREFAGIFAYDEIPGTNTPKREEFNRMIEECMAGRIDMIITMSVSRFARNILDCLKYIRLLKEKSILVFSRI